jgi:hypothetical protein
LVAAKGSRFAFEIDGAAEPRLGRVVNRFLRLPKARLGRAVTAAASKKPTLSKAFQRSRAPHARLTVCPGQVRSTSPDEA